MEVYEEIEGEMRAMKDDAQAAHLMRFFKCGKGEYGEGDRFLGIRCPQTRDIVKRFRKEAELSDCLRLVDSPWHEIRLAGFLLMIEIFNRYKKKHDEDGMRVVVACYIESIDRGNNWDLVDMVAPKILGVWLTMHPEEHGVLDRMAARDDSLWHQRVAVVTNWMLIRSGMFEDTFRIAEKMLSHPHDLIHKATGWMLREVGKHGGMKQLLAFLNRHAAEMPRTMLRYAIEKFPEPLRIEYLHTRHTQKAKPMIPDPQ